MVQVTHVENEKRILAAVSHPFIVRLVSAGLDTRFLYFVLPFIPGGELFSHLRAVRKFRKASLCIFVCVKYFSCILQIFFQLFRGPVLHGGGGVCSALPPLPAHRVQRSQAREPPPRHRGPRQDRRLRAVQVRAGADAEHLRDAGVRGAGDPHQQRVRSSDHDLVSMISDASQTGKHGRRSFFLASRQHCLHPCLVILRRISAGNLRFCSLFLGKN